MLTKHFNNTDVLTVTACGGRLEHGEGKQKVTRAKLCNRTLHGPAGNQTLLEYDNDLCILCKQIIKDRVSNQDVHFNI